MYVKINNRLDARHTIKTLAVIISFRMRTGCKFDF